MSAPDVERRFLAVIREWLVTLPHDLKILYEAASNENLERSARELAVGAIISMVSPSHLPGVPPGDFVNYCDGTILLRIALQRVVASKGDDTEEFRDRFREFFDELDDELEICRQAMGDDYQWLADKVNGFSSLEFKGKKVPVYLDDDDASEFLYEEGLEFQTEYEVDEDLLADRLKRSETVMDALAKRKKVDERQR